MAKIAFVQDTLYEYMGLMYVSALLKQHNHRTDIFILNEGNDVIKALKEFNPDLIVFSTSTGYHQWALNFAKEAKKHLNNSLIILGGMHPTLFGEVINEKPIDIICRGEGEYSFLELADSIDKGKINYNIEGLWFKKDGEIIKNPIRNLNQNLDAVPFPDRELLYSKYKFLRDFPTKRFLTSRGCPYNCSFCFENTLKKTYAGKGPYSRRRSPRNVIEEIKFVRSKYPLKSVRFIDDIFTLNRNWLKEFLVLYKNEIGLPFTCLARADELIDEEIVKLFKEAKCEGVTFGVETANEKIRNDVLHKSLKNEAIITAAGLLKKYKIKFGTYNMIGIPGETIEDAIETMKFNAMIKTDYPVSTIFQPYPKLDLTEYSIQHGYLDKEFNINGVSGLYDTHSLKTDYKDEFSNLEKFFIIGAKFPSTIPLIKKLIKLKPNKIYSLIGLLSFGGRSLVSYRIGLLNGIKMGSKMINQYLNKSKT